jgi:two-component system, OmpR family, alkaline phosphatase synthesis response regulator PhoP
VTRQETVLVVEDDPTLRLGLQKMLRSEGYRVVIAKTGAEGLAMALSEHPDVVLLDVMLPEMNGFEVCEEIRRRDGDMPILMLTAKGEEPDKVRGLRLGADDYVVKPFGVAELLARIDAALRRRRDQTSQLAEIAFGLVSVDFRSHRLVRDGNALEVTAHEMKLLAYFLRHEGALLSRQQILDGVWGADYFGTERTVDNFINRLRAKIEIDPRAPRHIMTVRGGGYRFSRKGDDQAR